MYLFVAYQLKSFSPFRINFRPDDTVFGQDDTDANEGLLMETQGRI
jgi:hypothetical protein